MNIKAGWMLLEGWQGGDDPVWMAVPRTEQMRGRLAGTGQRRLRSLLPAQIAVPVHMLHLLSW